MQLWRGVRNQRLRLEPCIHRPHRHVAAHLGLDLRWSGVEPCAVCSGGSMKQPGGCNPSPCTVAYPWKCSWQGPAMLPYMLDYQRHEKRFGSYNEVIISASSWRSPAIIEAVFEGSLDDKRARAVHADLTKTFGWSDARFPLLQWRSGNLVEPFAPASAHGR